MIWVYEGDEVRVRPRLVRVVDNSCEKLAEMDLEELVVGEH